MDTKEKKGADQPTMHEVFWKYYQDGYKEGREYTAAALRESHDVGLKRGYNIGYEKGYENGVSDSKRKAEENIAIATEAPKMPTVNYDQGGKVRYSADEPNGARIVPLTEYIPHGIDSISATYETSSNNLQCYQITYRTANKPYTFDLCEMEHFPFLLHVEHGTDNKGRQIPIYPLQEQAAEWLRRNIGYYTRSSILSRMLN